MVTLIFQSLLNTSGISIDRYTTKRALQNAQYVHALHWNSISYWRFLPSIPGDIHNGVHVVRLAEAVPEANEAQREAAAAAGVEAVVHADTVCAQVMAVMKQGVTVVDEKRILRALLCEPWLLSCCVKRTEHDSFRSAAL